MEGHSTLERNTLDALRAQVSGRVSTPGDDDYDLLRASWNLFVDQRPDVIVSARTESDVQAAVRFAAEAGLPVAVMATGHGQPKTCTSGVLIRTSELDQVSVDPAAQTATIGGGAKWGAVVQAAYPHGLAPLSGSSATVGVVGYLLGGGYGLMLRKYGLAVDHVKSFRVVLADGTAVEASLESHPDLFWALLGGGGAFGVITEVTLSLFPHAMVYGGAMQFPADRAKEVYRTYAGWSKMLPNDITTGIVQITFPPIPAVPQFLQGRSMVIVTGCMPADETQASEWLRPMRALEPEFDMYGILPYTESARIYNDPVDPLPANGRGVLLKDFTAETAEALLEAFGPPAESPNLAVQVRHLGGAMAEKEEDASAIGDRRRAQYLVYFLGVPMPHNPPEKLAAHAEHAIEALKPWVLSRGPLNWLGEAAVQSSEIRDVYAAADFERLRSIKQQYDPANRFRFAGVGLYESES